MARRNTAAQPPSDPSQFSFFLSDDPVERFTIPGVRNSTPKGPGLTGHEETDDAIKTAKLPKRFQE